MTSRSAPIAASLPRPSLALAVLISLASTVPPAAATTWTPFTVTAPDGVVIPAVVSDPGDGQRHPTILHLHGAPGARGADAIMTLATQGLPAERWLPLLADGFVVCVSDWRGHPPDRPFDVLRGDINATDDLLAVLDHLKSLPTVDTTRIGLVGDSMGGGITLMTFLERPLGPALLCFPASGAFIGYSGPQAPGCTLTVSDAQVDLDSVFIRMAPITRAVHLQQGTEDGLCSLNRKLDELLLRGGKDARYSEFAGALHSFTNGPDNAAFRTAIAEMHDFFVEQLGESSAAAPVVTGLAALHHDGQTFLTWNVPAATGWRYRVYVSTAPIASGGDLASAALVGSVGDSTWCDRRLSSLRGVTYGYAIDSLAPSLTVAKGLLVATPASSGTRYYAVTAQPGAGAEDTTIALGQNSLVAPVTETLAEPRPVYQRTLTQGPITFEVYTTWTSPADTPLFPAMGTVHGLAFDCAVVRGGTRGGLMVKPHARGGNFLNGLPSSGEPGEWRLCLDDYLYASTDRNTFWYGYHAGYDPLVATHVAPTSGLVVDFTLRRIVHTLAWARRFFPVDTTRVYASGGSMGGIGSLMLSYRVPQWIAAIQAVIPKFDFSLTNDPNPGNAWNAGAPERAVGDRLWGAVATNLPTSDDIPVYDRLDEGVLAGLVANVSLPVIFAFNGRNDTVVGWAEKIPHYAATQTHRHGGAYFFDRRDHGGTIPGAWGPMQNARYLYRFRTNRSYPAFSQCSADGDPGNGLAANGDSIGALNGFMEWDTTLTDEPGKWECTLRLRNLTSLWGVVVAPESLTVDVTPRRLQRLVVGPGSMFTWRATRVSDGIVTQGGTVNADSLGLVTVAGLRVPRAGVVLTIESVGTVSVNSPLGAGAAIVIRLGAQPLRGRAELEISWPAAGPAEVALFDVAGRRVRTLLAGEARPGAQRLVIEARDLPGGVFFVIARQGSLRATRRVVVLR